MLSLLFSLPVAAGTAIGHPDIHGAVGPDLVIDTFQVQVSWVVLRRCNGTFTTVTVDDTLAEGNVLTLPSGCFDRLWIDAEEVAVTGTGLGGTFALTLAPGVVAVALEDDLLVPGTAPATLRFADDGWISGSLLDLAPGVHRVVGPGHPLYAPLGDALREGSAVQL